MSAYAYGMRFDDDSNAITVIDEENQTAATTGYINGEPVEFSGGGGSSDFSTAEVTVTSNGGPAVEVYGILRDVGEIVGLPDSFYAVDDYNDNPTGEITLIIVLYQGHALMAVWDADTISKSGNIETILTPDSGEIFDITGDCTITTS